MDEKPSPRSRLTFNTPHQSTQSYFWTLLLLYNNVETILELRTAHTCHRGFPQFDGIFGFEVQQPISGGCMSYNGRFEIFPEIN